MAFNGSGSFLINSAGQPVVSGTVISSTAFNALTADLATGLSTCITKDGQTTVTANIPMAGYKFTGLGTGSAAGDSPNLSQVQSTVVKLLASVSGADTITAVGSPTVAAYAAGQMFYFVAAGTNTGAVTLNIDSLGAKAVTRDGSTALIAGDIQSGEVCVVVYDGTRFQLINAANAFGTLTVTGNTYLATTSGNVGIGTSSPAQKLDVTGASNSVQARFGNVAGRGLTIGTTIITGTNDAGVVFDAPTASDGTLIFQTASVERARITSGGVLLVGATSNFGAADDRLQVDTATASARSGIFRNNTSATDTVGVWNSATTGDNLFIQFYTEAGASVRGNITYNRGAGQVAYNVTSDVRLKDNIADAVDAGSKVDALQVRQFDWKETGNHVDYGFVAQELDAVVPHAVSKPEDDEAMWSVDYSKLVPMLVKEIQSLRARVAALEAE